MHTHAHTHTHTHRPPWQQSAARSSSYACGDKAIFLKVPFILILYSKETRALASKNAGDYTKFLKVPFILILYGK